MLKRLRKQKSQIDCRDQGVHDYFLISVIDGTGYNNFHLPFGKIKNCYS